MRVLCTLLFVSFFMVNSLHSQNDVVLTIDDTDVTLEEFEYIYKKNNRDQEITTDSLDNYIDLFINFKLKVMEAKSMGLDTNAAFINELSGYRKQLSRPYLTDTDMLDEMVEEAYSRMTKEISARHILVKCEPNALPNDTLKAYNKIIKLRNRILKGEDFEVVAKGKSGSEDPSVKQNGGYLGYFTAFQMVYPFENAAFNTDAGSLSEPVRTKFGYHILEVLDVRDARGEMKAAHIMVMIKDGQDETAAETKANDIYNQLMEGADFADMALKYSDDTGTKRNGGQLPWFGTGKMIPEFEEAAFAIQENGEISKPVKTENGFFIIKRLDYKPIPTFKNVEKELKTKISRDARSEVTKNSFVEKMKKEYNFLVNDKIVDEFRSRIDTNIYNGIINVSKRDEKKWEEILNSEICNVDGISIKAQDFMKELSRSKMRIRKDSPLEVFESKLKKFLDGVVIDYEDSRLEEKYNDFRLLMNEYRDGMLLFELTDDKVWSKAVRDTIGLESFYQENKNNYMWPDRVDGTIYTCIDKKVAKKAYKMVKKGKSHVEIESVLNQSSSLNFQHDSDTFLKGVREEIDLFGWNTGVHKPVEYNGQYVFLKADSVMESKPKEFEETRGPVTADYQRYLEEEWINELRSKYKFELNKEVLYKLAE